MRVPAELDEEISEIIKKEKLDKATVVRNLLQTGITKWRKQSAVELLDKGKVSFAEAADMCKAFSLGTRRLVKDMVSSGWRCNVETYAKIMEVIDKI